MKIIYPVRLLAVASMGILLPLVQPRGARALMLKMADAYALRPIYKNGDAMRYRLTVRFTTANVKTDDLLALADARFVVVMREIARDVTPGGAATLDDQIEKADAVFDEHATELTGAMPRIAQTRDKTGAVTLTLTGGLEQIREPVRQVFLLLTRTERSFVPPVPVHAAETWKIERQESGDVEGSVRGAGTLIGMETLGGQPTLKIKADFTAALNAPDLRKGGKVDIASHFIGTENVDAKTFQIVRLQGASDDTLAGGEKAKTEITLEQLKDAPQAAIKDK